MKNDNEYVRYAVEALWEDDCSSSVQETGRYLASAARPGTRLDLWSNGRQKVDAPEECGSGWSKNLDPRSAKSFTVLCNLT
ncbi:unnamed protein product [Echinostoma caproni]|uniref:SRCR domain-containing protein n=1 Tax=Echinostoma caproni TaxID=27848 RepID=A0A183BGT2_9TREM|nr:unnamed protein product [Echinostoma caproni]